VNAGFNERLNGFAVENELFDKIIRTEETQRRLHAYNEHIGQDRDKELKMGLK